LLIHIFNKISFVFCAYFAGRLFLCLNFALFPTFLKLRALGVVPYNQGKFCAAKVKFNGCFGIGFPRRYYRLLQRQPQTLA
jgi:hypothetical protein